MTEIHDRVMDEALRPILTDYADSIGGYMSQVSDSGHVLTYSRDIKPHFDYWFDGAANKSPFRVGE